MQGLITIPSTMLRASFTFSAPTLQRFNAVVPKGERSRLLERYMQQAFMEREGDLENVAAAFMADAANAQCLSDEGLWDVTVGDGIEAV